MARTVWGEARGENTTGRVAVAWVIKNRADHPAWWGSSIRTVCLAPWQFSCWNANDPNRSKMLDPQIEADPAYRAIKQICIDVLTREVPDTTFGANHYCVTRIAPSTSWAVGKTPTAIIGAHSFYKL
jgi:spore germination cell wall hydrolase CwlJ-like protein